MQPKIPVGEHFSGKPMHQATRIQQCGADLDRRESAGFDQDMTESDAIVGIDIQDLNGGRSALRFAC